MTEENQSHRQPSSTVATSTPSGRDWELRVIPSNRGWFARGWRVLVTRVVLRRELDPDEDEARQCVESSRLHLFLRPPFKQQQTTIIP